MVKTRKRRLFLLISSITIVILLVGAGAWWFMRQSHVPENITKSLGSTAEAQNQRAVTTQSYAADKDTSGGIEYYNQLLDHTSANDEKRTLLLEKAWFAASMKDYDVALASVNAAEAIKKDTSTILRKAQIYEQKGDKQAAIAQYNEALAVASADKSGFSERYSYKWKLKIEELSK